MRNILITLVVVVLVLSPVVAQAGSLCKAYRNYGPSRGYVSEVLKRLCDIEIWLTSSGLPEYDDPDSRSSW